MNETERAYIAGIVDGEGSVSMCLRNTKPKHYDVKVSISNSSKQLIDYLKNLFPLFNIFTQKDKRNKNWKRRYELYSSSLKNIKIFLESILPFLIVKKEQARLLLEYIEIRNKVFSRGSHQSIHPQRENEIYFQLKEINQKGRKDFGK